MAKRAVIEGTDVTASQLKEFFTKVAAGVITRRALQGFLEQLRKGALASAIATTFVTADYFITRPGLWVSSGFASHITAAYPEALVSRGLDGVEGFNLTKPTSGRGIIDQMGDEENVRKHAFTPDQIGALIDLQPEGAEGRLLTNRCANLFPVVGNDRALFVVYVWWDAGSLAWDVLAWRLDENCKCDAGSRLFHNTQV